MLSNIITKRKSKILLKQRISESLELFKEKFSHNSFYKNYDIS